MKHLRVSKRYAGALLDLSVEMKKVDDVARDMALLHKQISETRELKLFFESPVIDKQLKRKIIERLYSDNVDELTMRFLLLLVDKGREMLVDGVAHEFSGLLDTFRGIERAEVHAPFSLTELERGKIQSKLEKITGKKVRLMISDDKTLIGGFLARIGDTVYDGSIRRQLEILKKELAESAALQN